LAAVFRLLRLALAAACSWVRTFSLSLMMILTWASVAVTLSLTSLLWEPVYIDIADPPSGHF
jgi:hypothetical protein